MEESTESLHELKEALYRLTINASSGKISLEAASEKILILRRKIETLKAKQAEQSKAK
jgi:hypothetical protein